MFRYFFVSIFFIVPAAGVQAASAQLGDCSFSNISATNEITVDPVLAPIESIIGSITISATVDNCTAPLGKEYWLRLPMQQRWLGSNDICESSHPSVGLSVKVATPRTGCQYLTGNRGPIIGHGYYSRGFPQTYTNTFAWIKKKEFPVGVTSVGLEDPELYWDRDMTNGRIDRYKWPLDVPPGEVIGTTCALASTNVKVDFGSISGTGAIKPFEIEFDTCTDQADAVAYNDAVSLSFSSELIKPDGSALRNGACSDCARGIQIGLQDGNGNPINLNTPYALSSNGAVAISPVGLVYSFNAEIQPNADEAASTGPIDAQLVFETVVE